MTNFCTYVLLRCGLFGSAAMPTERSTLSCWNWTRVPVLGPPEPSMAASPTTCAVCYA